MLRYACPLRCVARLHDDLDLNDKHMSKPYGKDESYFDALNVLFI